MDQGKNRSQYQELDYIWLQRQALEKADKEATKEVNSKLEQYEKQIHVQENEPEAEQLRSIASVGAPEPELEPELVMLPESIEAEPEIYMSSDFEYDMVEAYAETSTSAYIEEGYSFNDLLSEVESAYRYMDIGMLVLVCLIILAYDIFRHTMHWGGKKCLKKIKNKSKK